MKTASYTALHSALRVSANAAILFALIGCANGGVPTAVPQAASLHSSRPASASGFTFYTVDYPYTSPNRVTGIADNQEIVGVYGGGGSSNPYHSYTSEYSTSQPYTQFQHDDFPNASSTYMSSIMIPPHSTGIVQAGYVTEAGDLPGTWGVINNQGLWTLIDEHSGERKCYMMELFGINSSYFAVGDYWYEDSPPSGGCTKYTQKMTERRPGGWHDYPGLQGAYPVAMGINSDDWLVGSTDNSGTGPSQGWTKEICKGCPPKTTKIYYWNFNNDTKNSTQMLGVNDSDVVVGTYQDSGGNSHGFIVTNVFPPYLYPVWQSIDEPSGNGTSTVVSGIDSSGDICGWYTGSDGQTHGFVGIHT